MIADLFKAAEMVAREHDCTAVMAITREEDGLILIAMGRLNADQNDPHPPQIKALLQRLEKLIEADKPGVEVIAMKGMALDHDAKEAIEKAIQKEMGEE
jgi:Holliday junction resolvasome RuvABC endonuclease subunit